MARQVEKLKERREGKEKKEGKKRRHTKKENKQKKKSPSSIEQEAPASHPFAYTPTRLKDTSRSHAEAQSAEVKMPAEEYGKPFEKISKTMKPRSPKPTPNRQRDFQL